MNEYTPYRKFLACVGFVTIIVIVSLGIISTVRYVVDANHFIDANMPR